MKSKKTTREKALAALEKESELAVRDLIRRRLALPMNKRTHFLRTRLPIQIKAHDGLRGGGSAL